MTLKKIILTISVFMGSYIAYKHFTYVPKPVREICIMQIAPHPSLDKIREGILSIIKSEAPSYLSDVREKNAQGSPALSTQIAQQAVNANARIIVPITTPCTLSAYQAAHAQNIPVVFACVTDPRAAKISKDNVKHIDGISGISDYMDPLKQVAFLKDLFKDKPYKKIGTIYNIGEQNTVAQIDEFEKALSGTGYSLTKVSVHQSVDIGQAALKLSESVDFILIFNDNLVVSAMPQVLQIAKKYNIPVISTDPESVELGAVAALAYDQYEMGRQTGKMVLKVLDGEDLSLLIFFCHV